MAAVDDWAGDGVVRLLDDGVRNGRFNGGDDVVVTMPDDGTLFTVY